MSTESEEAIKFLNWLITNCLIHQKNKKQTSDKSGNFQMNIMKLKKSDKTGEQCVQM